MGYWNVLEPEQTYIENLITNPSFEKNVTGWVHNASRALTRVSGGSGTANTSPSRFGAWGLRVSMGAGVYEGIYYAISAPSTTSYVFSISVRAPNNGVSYRVCFTNTSDTLVGSATTFVGDGKWHRIATPAVSLTSGTTYRLYVSKNNSANLEDIYIDGAMLIVRNYDVWYFDGDKEGATWLGADHASISRMSAGQSESGKLVNLDTYSFYIEDSPQAGAGTSDIFLREYAGIPGAEYSGYRDPAHAFDLVGQLIGTSREDLHLKRKVLRSKLKVNRAINSQIKSLVYTGNGVDYPVVKGAIFSGEGFGFKKPNGFAEKLALRAKAPDPYWYGEADVAYPLVSYNDLTSVQATKMVLKRVNDAWSNIGAGADLEVKKALIEKSTGDIIFVGQFTTFAGTTVSSIARYNLQTGAVTTMGGTSCNGVIEDIAQASDGTIYIVGNFTIAPDGTSATRIAKTTNGTTWTAIGSGLNGRVWTVCISDAGVIYVGGEFTTAGGVTVNYVARYEAASWQTLGGTSCNNTVYKLVFDEITNTLYMGGAFTVVPTGGTAYRIAKYNVTNTTWYPIAEGFDAYVRDILVNDNGTLIACGSFAALGTVATPMFAVSYYNGYSWVTMGDGFPIGYMICLLRAADGDIYCGGTSTLAGTIPINGIAKWTGAQWVPVDTQLGSSSGVVNTMVMNSSLDFIIGGIFTSVSARYSSNVNSLINYDTAISYPIIKLKNLATAAAQLIYLRNNTTGATIYFRGYNTITNEEITLDFRPGHRSIKSNLHPNIWSYVLRGSEFEHFYLVPGINNVSAFFIPTSGTPNMETTIQWRETYDSFDGIAT